MARKPTELFGTPAGSAQLPTTTTQKKKRVAQGDLSSSAAPVTSSSSSARTIQQTASASPPQSSTAVPATSGSGPQSFTQFRDEDETFSPRAPQTSSAIASDSDEEDEEEVLLTRNRRDTSSRQDANAGTSGRQEKNFHKTFITDCKSLLGQYLIDRQHTVRQWFSSHLLFGDTRDLRNAQAKEAEVNNINDELAKWNPENLDSTKRLLIYLSIKADESQKDVSFSFIWVKSDLAIAIEKIKDKIWEYLTAHQQKVNLALISAHERLLKEANNIDKNAKPEDELDISKMLTAKPLSPSRMLLKPVNEDDEDELADEEEEIEQEEESNNLYTNRFKTRADQLKYEANHIYPADKARAAYYKHVENTYKRQAK